MIVAERLKHPQAFAAHLAADPELAASWAAMQRSQGEGVQELRWPLMNTPLDQIERMPLGRLLRRGARGTGLERMNTLDRDAVFAALSGEISRIEADGLEHVDMPNLAPGQREKTAAEPDALNWYLNLVPVVSALAWQAKRGATGPVADWTQIQNLIERMQRIQEKIGTGRITRNLIPNNVLPSWSEEIAGKAFLPPTDIADAFEHAYASSWHTKPRTKTTMGGFTEALRDRIKREGDPALLILLAASSDGRNRATAAASAQTPPRVWEKLIYDNSLQVLSEVAQNPRFNDTYAYAMMDTKLAPQITAVMLHGRVHTSIRVLAAKQAIEHPGVDPAHIFRFLLAQRGNADVPPALWRDLVRTQLTRLQSVESKGDVEATKRLSDRFNIIRKEFVPTVLLPWAEARRLITKAGGNPDDPTEGAPASYYQRAAWSQGRKFLAAHDFLKDPIIFDLLVEGATTGESLLELLKLHRECGFPVSKRLLVRVLTHKDPTVRLEAIRLVPNKDDLKVEVLAAELDAEVAAQYSSIATEVSTIVIPDYEKIDGEARRVSRQHHHFAAATRMDAKLLEDEFVRTAETDPRQIPAKIRAMVLQRDEEAAAIAAGAPPQSSEGMMEPLPNGPATQGDLFDTAPTRRGQKR